MYNNQHQSNARPNSDTNKTNNEGQDDQVRPEGLHKLDTVKRDNNEEQISCLSTWSSLKQSNIFKAGGTTLKESKGRSKLSSMRRDPKDYSKKLLSSKQVPYQFVDCGESSLMFESTLITFMPSNLKNAFC